MAKTSPRDRIKRREPPRGTTYGLIVGALLGVMGGCARSTPEPQAAAGDGASAGSGEMPGAGAGGDDGDAQQQLDAASAGAAGYAGGGGGGAAGAGGSPSTADAAVDASVEPCPAGQSDRLVDFQVTAAFRTSNPFGIVADPRVFRPTPESLPWLEEPFCQCFDAETLGDHMFETGETSLALFGMHPYYVPNDPSMMTFLWSNDELFENVTTIEKKHPGRALAQVTVMPNDRLDVQLAMMERLAPRTAAWKVFTEWYPASEGGFFLDEGNGPAMIEKALALSVPIIVVQKGRAMGTDMTFSSPRDIGPIANTFPTARFVVTNAAFEHGLDSTQTSAPDLERPDEDLGWGRGVGEWPEGPYEEVDASVMEKYPLVRGVNSLIKSLRDAGIGPNGARLDDTFAPRTHVYVTSGAAWPSLISRPEEAMHFWGKLLVHIGEDRILWGTDSPSFGPPRVMIERFRAFEISTEFQERYGYPALTPAIKAKILGGNALRLFAETGRELARCE